MSTFFDEFNELQLKAIKSNKNKICVYAGPGTGKTKTLVGRYVYLQKERCVAPSNILCLTFTKKAAEEMSDRIKKECGDNRSKYIGTIHSLGNKILSNDIYRIGFPNQYSILTEDDQKTIIFDMMKEMNLYEEENITFKDIISNINNHKQEDQDEYVELILNRDKLIKKIKEVNESMFSYLSPDVLVKTKLDKTYYLYLMTQCENYYLDFNDLIFVTNYLLSNYEVVLKKWSSKFRHILVDEFQDLTDAEYKMITLLSQEYECIFGVGDPDQSIYGFRGSDVTIFNKFYNEADEKIDLNINYRSYQEVLDLSHDLISKNDGRVADVDLIADKNHGTIPHIIHTNDRYSEAIYVAEKIKELKDKGVNLSECAILYRMNQCSLVFEEYFQMKKIPYKVYSTNEFFNCDEVKTALAYFKFMIYHDNVSFLKVYKKPTRYVSNVMIDYIKREAKDNNLSYWQIVKDDYRNPIFKNTFTAFVSFVNSMETRSKNDNFKNWALTVLNESGYLKYIFSIGDEDKVNHIKQLLDMIQVFETDDSSKNEIEQFLDYIALLCDGDSKEEVDKVQMMTIHCSKGLQYKYVFLVDFNEGYIPSSKVENIKDVEEERRVAYVALTRAEEELYILESNGDDGNLIVSSFLNDIDEKHYQLKQYIPRESKTRKEITVGCFVQNKLYGVGYVKSIDYTNKKCSVKFDEVYKEKEVELSSLVNLVNRNNLMVAMDPKIASIIRRTKKIEYVLGDIVLHNTYGVGIITNINNNDAFIQFKDIQSNFNLDSDYIIKRSEYLDYFK